jgi:hypothetical protein
LNEDDIPRCWVGCTATGPVPRGDWRLARRRVSAVGETAVRARGLLLFRIRGLRHGPAAGCLEENRACGGRSVSCPRLLTGAPSGLKKATS